MVFNPHLGQDNFIFPKNCDWFWGPPNHLINRYWGSSTTGVNRLEREVSTHLNLVMGLRMSTVLPLLPLSTSPQYQTFLASSQHNNVVKVDHKKGWSVSYMSEFFFLAEHCSMQDVLNVCSRPMHVGRGW